MTEAITSHLPPVNQRLAGLADVVRPERALVLIGCSVVGLHLVDDNFLQPQPGTSAGDHLVSGLVPLALVAGATLAYGRVRPGARAALALLLGYFGVLIGTEAAYYTVAGGRSGDDYTGLLSLLTGVLLLGAGTVMLWRSRRRDDRLVHRYLRRSLIGVGVLALIAIVLFPTALAYVVTHTLRGAVPTANLGADYEDVAFTDERRFAARGLVRALPQRRDRDRLSRTLGPAEAGPHADPPRIRRPPLRPSRRRGERG